MSRWSGKRHPWKPAPKKVKAQLAVMDDFFGARNGPGAPASADSDHKPTGDTRRVIANSKKP